MIPADMPTYACAWRLMASRAESRLSLRHPPVRSRTNPARTTSHRLADIIRAASGPLRLRGGTHSFCQTSHARISLSGSHAARFLSTLRCRSRSGSPWLSKRRTSRASSIVISSRLTSKSEPTAPSRYWTSVSPKPWTRCRHRPRRRSWQARPPSHAHSAKTRWRHSIRSPIRLNSAV
jgi:hypothetical protein